MANSENNGLEKGRSIERDDSNSYQNYSEPNSGQQSKLNDKSSSCQDKVIESRGETAPQVKKIATDNARKTSFD